MPMGLGPLVAFKAPDYKSKERLMRRPQTSLKSA